MTGRPDRASGRPVSPFDTQGESHADSTAKRKTEKPAPLLLAGPDGGPPAAGDRHLHVVFHQPHAAGQRYGPVCGHPCGAGDRPQARQRGVGPVPAVHRHGVGRRAAEALHLVGAESAVFRHGLWRRWPHDGPLDAPDRWRKRQQGGCGGLLHRGDVLCADGCLHDRLPQRGGGHGERHGRLRHLSHRYAGLERTDAPARQRRLRRGDGGAYRP